MNDSPSVLFVNQHYWPDVASTGQHLTDLAEHLAEAGFRVGVLTGTAGYTEERLDRPRREERRGVTIERLAVPEFRRGSRVGRALGYLVFHLQAFRRILTLREWDLVVSLTTPSLLPATVGMASGVSGRRYAVWAMDLHPEVEERMGAVPRGGLVTRLLHTVSEFGYREADVVVTLGPYMRRRLEAKGLPRERIREIPVWSRRDEIAPIPREDNPLARTLGIGEDFVVMYSGNAGHAHCFDEVLGAATRLEEAGDVRFIFVGGGPKRAKIEAFVEREGLRNFSYLDYFPRSEIDRSLSLADVHLLTLRSDMAGLSAPGKLYGSMAAGRPVIMVGPKGSDPAAVILENRIGHVIEPGAPEAEEHLAELVLRYRDRPEMRAEMGRRARECFLREFEKEVVCDRWVRLLDGMGGAGPPSPTAPPSSPGPP